MMSGLKTRLFTTGPVAILMCAVGLTPAAAQTAGAVRYTGTNGVAGQGVVRQIAAAVSVGDLHGTVLDDRGAPLAGAVVSAVGATSAFAVSEQNGTFTLRNLPAGPYLLRAHLQGYIPTRGRIIQVNAASRNVSAISLTRNADAPGEEPRILEAGVGAASTSGESTESDADVHEQSEVAWRLRHLKRSVLKDAGFDALDGGDASLFDGPQPAFAGEFAASPSVAGSWFADLALNGQVNLLTRTSFDRPQDVLSLDADDPRGVTYVSLSAPTIGGSWSMRGAMTQGDLSSWILSGAYVRRAPAAHQYEAGLTYGKQRYRGGNAVALAALPEGKRNVGAVYAFDNWAVAPGLDVSYGAKYARYDYLADRGLLSPRAALTLAPIRGSSFRIHAAVERREVAPGAEEFLPPSTGLWLPPERTFSPLTSRSELNPERIDRFEVSAERDWLGDVTIGVRAFRETVTDQVITLFGVTLPGTPTANIGHYYVASAGDFDAAGWGVSIHRRVINGVQASVDYTQTTADWVRGSADRARLLRAAPDALRTGAERVHDVTASVESQLPSSATRVLVVYKINSAFANANPSAHGPDSRFQMQVNQALPFLNFSSAQWEMLFAIRNLFSDDFRDGSLYDELLVVRPPTRVVGGLTVRF
jgi:hypothetical protein